jgi:tetratricopeptide (TPR) repeat protein
VPGGRPTADICLQLHTWGAWDQEASLIYDSLSRLAAGSSRQARWFHQLGTLARDRGEYVEAARQYQRALDIYERLGDQAGMAKGYYQTGNVAFLRGDYGKAARQYQRALDTFERLGDQFGMASSYGVRVVMETSWASTGLPHIGIDDVAHRTTMNYMSNPLSVRLNDATIARLGRHAQRVHLAPRTLAQRYVEEGLRMDEHPLIRFADGPAGRRARLVGTGKDVWEVIATVRDNGGDAAEAARYLEIPLGLVQAAITYYGAYQDEIDQWIEANEQEAAEASAAWSAGQAAVRQ